MNIRDIVTFIIQRNTFLKEFIFFYSSDFLNRPLEKLNNGDRPRPIRLFFIGLGRPPLSSSRHEVFLCKLQGKESARIKRKEIKTCNKRCWRYFFAWSISVQAQSQARKLG